MNELEQIPGIGPKTVTLLEKLGIRSKDNLLHYYPFRYEVIKRTDLSLVNDGDNVTIDGIVEGQPTTIFLSKKLKKIIFRINCKKTIVNVTVYNQVYLNNELKYGKEVTIIGKYDRLKNTIVAKEVRFGLLPDIPVIEPVYYTTSGLSRKNIAKFITNALATTEDYIDYIPDYLSEKYNFISKKEALINIHNPSDILLLKKARQRLKYEELFMYLLKVNYLKMKIKDDKLAIKRNIDVEEVKKFISQLTFTLTTDQIKATMEIISDLNSDKRMNRLLQGDVGSGKTIVAFISAYANYLAGYQTAMMVPTEILAIQHYDNAIKLFSNYNLKIALLTGSVSKKNKEEILTKLENGEIDFVIGTQALIQDKIVFKNLGLVITDEQHRFGVNQRNNFKNKGTMPDILSMSATPIPRTYALTIYGDMDVSSIVTKPEGRKEVITYAKKEKDLFEILTMMKKELDQKHQIYVIAPSIEEDDDSYSVIELKEKMEKAFVKIAKIEVVHGKLESEEKEKVMRNFEKSKIDILISTTVIEVGVNVPNASMIVIFNANLFGLSTLHQLRGRVGRGDIQSYCILISKENCDRLKFLENNNDGFKISEYDFENRGEGDLFGVRQSGETGLILANINRDFKMLVRVKEDVVNFMSNAFNEQLEQYDHIYKELDKISNLN